MKFKSYDRDVPNEKEKEDQYNEDEKLIMAEAEYLYDLEQSR